MYKTNKKNRNTLTVPRSKYDVLSEPKPDMKSVPKPNTYAENNTWNEFRNLRKNDNSYILIRYNKEAILPNYGIVYENIHEDKYVKVFGDLLEKTENKCGYFKFFFNKKEQKYANLFKIIDNLDDSEIFSGNLMGFALIREKDYNNYKIKLECDVCLGCIYFDTI
jgi:hypothetical protein